MQSFKSMGTNVILQSWLIQYTAAPHYMPCSTGKARQSLLAEDVQSTPIIWMATYGTWSSQESI